MKAHEAPKHSEPGEDPGSSNPTNSLAHMVSRAIDASKEIVFVTDTNGIFLYVNRAFTDVYGYAPDDIVGTKTPRILKSGLQPDAFYENLWKGIVIGGSFRADMINVTRGGTHVEIEASIDPMLDMNGTIEGFLAVQRDVTEHRAAARSLRDSEERFRTLVDSMDDFVFTLDGDRRFSAVHGKWLTMGGWQPEFFLGKRTTEIFGEADGSIHMEMADRVLAGESVAYEWSYQMDDRRVFFHTVMSPLFGGNGHAKGVVGIGRDITVLREAQDQMARSEREFKELYHSTPIGVISVDPQGRIVRCNRTALAMFEVADSDAIGVRVAAFFGWDRVTKSVIQKTLMSLKEGKDHLNTEVPTRTASGKPLWISLTSTTIRNGDGGISGWHLALVDITAKKEAKERLRMNEVRLDALLALSKRVWSSENEIIDVALEDAVALTLSAIGYVHFIDPDGVSLQLMYWSRSVHKHCEAQQTSHYPIERAGIWMDCFREGRPVIHNDYAAEAGEKGLPEGHIPLRRHMSVPVFDNGKIVAVAGVGNKAGPYDDDDARQLMLFMTEMWQIVERFKMARSVEQARDAYLSIFNDFPSMIWRSSESGSFDYLNPRWTAFTGATDEELLGDGWLELIHPDDREHVETALAKAMASNDRCHLEFRLRHVSGEYHQVDCRANPFVEVQTGRKGYVGSIVDLRNLRKAEHENLRLLTQQDLLLRTVGEGIYGVDSDGRCIFINAAAERYLGWLSDEVIGKDMHALINHESPDGRPIAEDECPVRRALEAGKSSRMVQAMLRRKDGRSFHAEYTVQPVVEDGGTTGAVVSFRDVSDRERDTRKLRESVDQYKGLMDAGTDAIIIVDVRTQLILEVNAKAITLFGGDTYSLIGRTYRTLFPNDIQDTLDPVVAEEPNTMRKTFEAVIMARSGERIPVEISNTIITVHDITILQAVFRDIRDRKRIEAELLQRTSLFEQLFRSSPIGITLLGGSGEIMSVNPSFVGMFGFPEDEWAGKQLLDLIVPQEKKDEWQTYNRPSQNNESYHYESVRVAKSGEQIDVLIHGFPIIFAGEKLGSYVMYTDIREQKRMTAQFMRAQRMESIGVLAGGIAHDLNNVLGPILLSVEFLSGSVKDAAAVHVLEVVEKAAKRGAGIVRQILSFARGAEGERGPMNMKHVINEMRDLVQQTFPSSIHTSVAVQKDLWLVHGDATQMHQVLLNLCVNARDAMPQGGSLTITGENFEADEAFAAMNPDIPERKYVHLTVSDTGTGIPPDIREKIFDPFFTTKERGKGTGLGLSTVVGIVRSYQGHIDIDTAPSLGTTFHVYFPAEEIEADSVQAADDTSKDGSGEAILIIDDEESILHVMAQSAEKHGYRVFAAKDGAEAVVIAAEQRAIIRCAIVDVMMPLMDGTMTLRALRRVIPDLPAIAISGMEVNEDRLRNDVKFNSFLHKPFTAAAMLAALRSVLGAAKGDAT